MGGAGRAGAWRPRADAVEKAVADSALPSAQSWELSTRLSTVSEMLRGLTQSQRINGSFSLVRDQCCY